MKKDILIIGAGASGIGLGVIFKKLNLDFLILEKNKIGHSFNLWTKETRFISPSFTGNFFNMPDLNAITPDSSPAYTLLTEHPTGKEYSKYLNAVAEHYDLPIKEKTLVKNISKKDDIFIIETNNGIYESNYLVWAAGEYQYPKNNVFKGSNLCLHNSKIKSYKSLEGNEFVVIGAYESGMDAAINLSKIGKKVIVLDSHDNLRNILSDSSYSLSPFTRDRFKEHSKNINIVTNSRVNEVYFDKKYFIKTKNNVFVSKNKPILATGFDSSLILVKDHFEFNNGNVILNDNDESTKTKNLFLVGPQVIHNDAIFCFIYKFRQRFPIIAETIGKRLKLDKIFLNEIIDEYKKTNFYIKDLSNCGDSCSC